MSARTAIFWGALLAAAAVGLGAYGAHGLDKQIVALGYEAQLTKRADWFDTGVKYHMVHAAAMILVGLIAEQMSSNRLVKIAPVLFLAGTLLFSGSLYAMTFLSDSWSRLGAITPLGGALFIAGWMLVAVGVKR